MIVSLVQPGEEELSGNYSALPGAALTLLRDWHCYGHTSFFSVLQQVRLFSSLSLSVWLQDGSNRVEGTVVALVTLLAFAM